MSSTNRSDSRDSHIADYYVTPIEDIQTFLDAFLANHEDIDLSTLTILDPCAGGNSEHTMFIQKAGIPGYEEVIPEHPMSYPTVLQRYNPKQLITNDIREDSPAEHHRLHRGMVSIERIRYDYN